MNKKQEEQFKKVWEKATGQSNIVGDLIIKDFISSLLKAEREDIIKIGNKLREQMSYAYKQNKEVYNRAIKDYQTKINPPNKIN